MGVYANMKKLYVQMIILFIVEVFANMRRFVFYIKPSSEPWKNVMLYILNYIQI